MPPRRPHSKSRLGCKQCKQRRVKCDETYPTCYNCERREFDCSFQYAGPPPQKPPTIPTRSLAGSSVDSAGHFDAGFPSPLWSTVSSDGPFSRSAELQLMHQWSVRTCGSLAESPAELHRVQHFLPELALKNQFLLDAMFSLTSLHLALCDAEERYRYGDMSMTYQERALTQFRLALGNPQPEQGPALFYASTFIGIITFALPRIYPTEETAGPTATLINISRLFSGTAAVINLCKQMMGEDEWNHHFPVNPAPEAMPLDPVLVSIFQRLRMVAAETDRRLDESIGPQRIGGAFYTTSVERLQMSLERRTDNTLSSLAWPVLVGTEFNNRLEAGDPLARLITVCYGHILHKLEHKWWAMNSGQDLVDELSPWVLDTNPEWSDIINAVRTSVGLRLIT